MKSSVFDYALRVMGKSPVGAMLAKCAAFDFGASWELGMADEVDPKTEGEADDAFEGFFLPFPYTFVEDRRSGVALMRTAELQEALTNWADQHAFALPESVLPEPEHGGSPLGLKGKLFAVTEFFRLSPTYKDGAYVIAGQVPERCAAFATTALDKLSKRRNPTADALLMRSATIQPIERIRGDKWRLKAGIATYFAAILDENGSYAADGPLLGSHQISGEAERVRDVVTDFQAATMQVVAINSPANIIVERVEAVTEMLRRKDGKGRPKVRQRVRLLVLPRAKAYELVSGDKTALGAQRAAHARRRHWRMLRSPRYREEKRGTRICVRECWVGPTERVEGNVRYRVRLDIGAPLPTDPKQIAQDPQ